MSLKYMFNVKFKFTNGWSKKNGKNIKKKKLNDLWRVILVFQYFPTLNIPFVLLYGYSILLWRL